MKRFMLILGTLAVVIGLAQDTLKVPARKRRIGTGPGYERLLAPVSGKIVKFVNGQEEFPPEVIAEMARIVTTSLGYVIEIQDGNDVESGFSDGRAGLVLFFDGKDKAPSILVAPEASWAAIGVKALRSDSPAPELAKTRLQKEVWRAFSYALGAGNEVIPSVLHPILSLKDLDFEDAVMPTPAVLPVLGDGSVKRDLTRERYVSYRQACREGWAPEPTNDMQRVFWEEAKAKRTKTPSNPIRITK